MNKNITKILITGTIMVLCMGTPVSALGSSQVKLNVNGKALKEDGQVINGKLYVPVESIKKELDIGTEWSSDKKSINIHNQSISIPKVINKVGPSVVGIMGKVKQSSQNYSESGDNLVFGTGVIYKATGYIMTNAHVVQDMESIVVVLSNGKSYLARLKAIDEKSDLAMIKIDKGGLTPAEFGTDSDIVVGDPVVAIGTPLSFTLRNSATMGIVSGINRTADGEYRFIQSDAAINGGNSGGPLVNKNGKVIGINSVKYTGFGVEGLSFSIPVGTVKYVAGHFEKYGKVRRPDLGMECMEDVAARYGLPSNDGLTITDIKSDSAAEKFGLLVEDVIMAVDGVKVPTKIDYNEALKRYLPGSWAVLTIDRNGSIKKIKVQFEESK